MQALTTRVLQRHWGVAGESEGEGFRCAQTSCGGWNFDQSEGAWARGGGAFGGDEGCKGVPFASIIARRNWSCGGSGVKGNVDKYVESGRTTEGQGVENLVWWRAAA